MSHYRSSQFPKQKVKDSKKTDNWAKKCIDAAEDMALWRDDNIRQDYYNKVINYNLANDILDQSDVEKVCNPFGIKGGGDPPAKMQNYPIANPKIDLLVGEEMKRKFDFRATVINDDAISSKEKEKKKQLTDLIKEEVTTDQNDPNKTKEKLKDKKRFLDYEFQDIRERRAQHLLNYRIRKDDIQYEFSRGFFDALLAGEEIYRADIVAGEPVLKKCNPLNIHTVRGGESPYIEDSDIIVEDGYYSPGSIIDEFYDYLTPKQIDEIEDMMSQGNASGDGLIDVSGKEPSFTLDGYYVGGNSGRDVNVNDTNSQGYYGSSGFGGVYDDEGNIRVIRVVWRSYRRVGKLTYRDEDGEEQMDLVHEDYEPVESEGEEIEYIWISEFWEGTRIGASSLEDSIEGIYVKMKPRPIQFRTKDNLSEAKPGYIGTAYNINDSKAKSLMDRMKPYQYLYNAIMYRTELGLSKNWGKILELDTSKVPDNWDIDKWMHYATTMGIAVVDSFKEGNKGAATGKLAGNFNTTGKTLDMEAGNYIQQHIALLEFIEKQMGIISGVSEQRQGQIQSRELVGNVERSVVQSNHITEKWFKIHDNTKVRCLRALLETAKTAYKDRKKRLQYVTDDLSQMISEIDGEQFNEVDFGIDISDSGSDTELFEQLKQLAHAALQNDKLNFAQLMDIYSTESISTIKRKVERSEREKDKEEQEQAQKAQQLEMQKMKKEEENNAREHQLEKYKSELESKDKELDRISKEKIENMKLAAKEKEKLMDNDLNDNSIKDSIDMEKLENEREKIEKEHEEKQKELEKEEEELELEKKKHEDQMELERKKLKEEKQDDGNKE